jgi:hypothetical protein
MKRFPSSHSIIKKGLSQLSHKEFSCQLSHKERLSVHSQIKMGSCQLSHKRRVPVSPLIKRVPVGSLIKEGFLSALS